MEEKEKKEVKVKEVVLPNIYQKLQTVRCELQAMNLKKSGQNKFAGYSYYELADFIPAINVLMKKHGLTSVLQYQELRATLTIVNSDDPTQGIVFESPMAKVELKGCTAIQCLGAGQTYLRRYLFIAAFEIVETDSVDAAAPLTHITEEQLQFIQGLVDITNTDTERFCAYMKVKSLAEIDAKDYQKAVKALEAKKSQVAK